MTWDTVQQFLRIIMQAIGGMLLAKGYLSEDMVVLLTGGVLNLANVAWWAYWNSKKPT